MAQALSRLALPFCIVMFGTHNKFDFNDVLQRWKFIKSNAERRGMIIVEFSSNEKTKLLKAIRQSNKLPVSETNEENYNWAWYNAGYYKKDYASLSFVQDTVHVATKLRTRLLNTK